MSTMAPAWIQEVSPAPEAKLEAIDFATQVQPLLNARCYECHGNGKSKGKLALDSKESIFRERDGGAVVMAGDPQGSGLLARIALPAHDDDAMPPEGDRLSADEQALLARWIREGAVMPDRMADPPDAGAFALSREARQQVVTHADHLKRAGALVEARSRVDERVVINASLVDPPFGDAKLGLVLALNEAVVELNLSRSAVTESGLRALADAPSWPNLESIQLDGTAVTGGALVQLIQRAPALKSLNLHSSGLNDAMLLSMASASKGGSLRRIYVWNTNVSAEGVAAAAGANDVLVLVSE